MTENHTHNTDDAISTTADNCQVAKLEAVSKVHFETNITSQLPNALRTNIKQKEISVRITSKNRPLKYSDINTF